MNFIVFLDYLIISVVLIIIYNVIKKTESVKLVIGVMIVYALYIISEELGLKNTAHLLNQSSIFITISIVIVFQPELRMLLRKMGTFSKKQVFKEKDVIKHIEEAVFTLSKTKTGALIVFDQDNTLNSQFDNATPIDAKVTSELIRTIFHINTPLHDGAMIIKDDKIKYAGCKLQLTGIKREEYKNYGTRHMAAIENAEQYGIVAIVVSEETGNVSVVNENGLTRITSAEMLHTFFKVENEEKSWLKNFFKKN